MTQCTNTNARIRHTQTCVRFLPEATFFCILLKVWSSVGSSFQVWRCTQHCLLLSLMPHNVVHLCVHPPLHVTCAARQNHLAAKVPCSRLKPTNLMITNTPVMQYMGRLNTSHQIHTHPHQIHTQPILLMLQHHSLKRPQPPQSQTFSTKVKGHLNPQLLHGPQPVLPGKATRRSASYACQGNASGDSWWVCVTRESLEVRERFGSEQTNIQGMHFSEVACSWSVWVGCAWCCKRNLSKRIVQAMKCSLHMQGKKAGKKEQLSWMGIPCNDNHGFETTLANME